MAVDPIFLRIYGTQVDEPPQPVKLTISPGETHAMWGNPIYSPNRIYFTSPVSLIFLNIPDHLLRFNASLLPAPAPWTPAVGDKVRLRDPRPSGVWTGGEVDTVLPEYILVRWGDGIRSAEDLSAIEPVPTDEFAIQESESAPEEELDEEGFIIPKGEARPSAFDLSATSRAPNLHRWRKDGQHWTNTAESEPLFKVGDWARMNHRIEGSIDHRWGVVEEVVGPTVSLRTWWPALNAFSTFAADERDLALLHRGSGR